MKATLLLYSVLCSVLISVNSWAFETKARYAVLMDYNSGEILFDKDSYVAMAPSSMSKLMTTYIVFEYLKSGKLKMDDKFTVSEKAWRKQGSKMFLAVGSAVTVEDLLKGINVSSGNDACITVAEGLMGTEEDFANLMNKKAKELGLVNSTFRNSTGWPEDGHLMSALDLAKLAKRIIHDFPEYYHFFSMKEYSYNNIKQGNRNTLLGIKDLGVDGLKTGHADDAGYGVVVSAQKNNRRLIAVVNGLNNQKERALEAEKLLNYGFLNFTNVTVYKAGDIVDHVKVWLGSKSNVGATLKEDLSVTVPVEFSKDVKATVEHQEYIETPIKKGDVIGKLKVDVPDLLKRGEYHQMTYDLVAIENVAKMPFYKRIFAIAKHRIFGTK